jgi:hypothetical protein
MVAAPSFTQVTNSNKVLCVLLLTCQCTDEDPDNETSGGAWPEVSQTGTTTNGHASGGYLHNVLLLLPFTNVERQSLRT